jgi:hypothetical protein
MSKTWQDISDEEFFAIMDTTEAKELANSFHRARGYSEDHSMFLSCPCAHEAVNAILLTEDV